MTAFLFHIGTLALLAAAIRARLHPTTDRYVRSEPRSEIRDQRPQRRSEDVHCPMCDRPPTRFRSRENTIHGPNYCYLRMRDTERAQPPRLERSAGV